MILKPCPMCGGEASIGKTTIQRQKDDAGNYGTFTGYSVNCIYCGVNNRGIAEGFKTEERAAEQWNQRTEAAPTWRDVPDDSVLPPGSPVLPGTTLYACDERATWLYDLPPLPGTLSALRPEGGTTEAEARDACRWAALTFLHPVDIATVVMGAKDGTEMQAELAKRVDAFIAKARAAYDDARAPQGGLPK